MEVTREQKGDDIFIVNNILAEKLQQGDKYMVIMDLAAIKEFQQALKKLDTARTYSRTSRIRKGDKQRTFTEYRLVIRDPEPKDVDSMLRVRNAPIIEQTAAVVPVIVHNQTIVRQVTPPSSINKLPDQPR